MSKLAPLILCCLLTAASPIASQAPAVAAQARTELFTIQSAILREERTFEIYVPARPEPQTRLIYVLDGQAQFVTVVHALEKLGDTRHVVVGIGNIWLRDRDYTPTKVPASAFVNGAAAAASGGGRGFLAHLEKEAFPQIEARYGKARPRVLVGHSLGGLWAVDVLLTNPALFDGYVLIDPSLWWDNARLVAAAQDRLKQGFPPVDVFLAIANSRNNDRADVDAVRADLTENSALIRPSVLLSDELKASAAANGITFGCSYYKDLDHMSVFAPAVKDGLDFVLRQVVGRPSPKAGRAATAQSVAPLSARPCGS